MGGVKPGTSCDGSHKRTARHGGTSPRPCTLMLVRMMASATTLNDGLGIEVAPVAPFRSAHHNKLLQLPQSSKHGDTETYLACRDKATWPASAPRANRNRNTDRAHTRVHSLLSGQK